MTHSHCVIDAQNTAAVRQTALMDRIGDALDPLLHERHEEWLREQYLRDLEVIARCEEQIEREGGCLEFFTCMGAIAAGRTHG